ncbi:UDP-glucuronosyltransferase [Sergentomyia squamirostris]
MRLSLIILSWIQISLTLAADILMVTMGGTKSHKAIFMELSKGLIPRGHNVTFLNGFPADSHIAGLQEITPAGLVEYIQNYTNWDLLGARMRGDMPIGMWDIIRYPYESCDAMYSDAETKDLMNRHFDLVILDGAFPECALGMVYKYRVPFMFVNTVGFYMGSLSLAGNPVPYSVTPAFFAPLTDDMTFWQRVFNLLHYALVNTMHQPIMALVGRVTRRHFGDDMPHPYDLAKNVSFILQNGHPSVSYPRPYLPNVAEIACIHCKPAGPLPKDLEDFIAGAGESGFIYVSMGSSVKAANMPEHLRLMLVQTFARLPYHVLWKWEGGNAGMQDLPPNVKLGRWLPQQDILGHRKLRAFVTHGGLLSMYESVYHGIPVVTMPVFCDHDSNSAKAEADGYAVKLPLETLTADKLVKAITQVIHDPHYRNAAKKRQRLLRDQRNPPLETAIYWIEYVLRHKGAPHLQTPGRYLSWIQYYMLDVLIVCVAFLVIFRHLLKRITCSVRVHPVGDVRKEKIH